MSIRSVGPIDTNCHGMCEIRQQRVSYLYVSNADLITGMKTVRHSTFELIFECGVSQAICRVESALAL